MMCGIFCLCTPDPCEYNTTWGQRHVGNTRPFTPQTFAKPHLGWSIPSVNHVVPGWTRRRTGGGLQRWWRAVSRTRPRYPVWPAARGHHAAILQPWASLPGVIYVNKDFEADCIRCCASLLMMIVFGCMILSTCVIFSLYSNRLTRFRLNPASVTQRRFWLWDANEGLVLLWVS